VGIELTGLVPESLYGNTVYMDPISNASRTAALLKKEKKWVNGVLVLMRWRVKV
jgi:hypothetical protein